MTHRLFVPVLAASLAIATLTTATLAGAATLEVRPGGKYAQPSAAIDAAAAGDTVAIAPGTYFDCATVRTPHLTIEGVGDPNAVVMTDKACGGKALLVIDAPDVTVRNLTLTRARVPDGNGAGLRMEGGNLTVDGVHFVNNQNGILTAADPSWVLTVTNSVFDHNGACKEACAHGLYAGVIGKVIVRNSRFIGTKQAHHIKSRALYTEVTGCTIQDGPDGTASYLVEAPNGGTLIVRNSTLEKGPHAENHTAAIVIGDEGVTQPTGEITIENNTFTNDMADHRTAFVNNDTATEATLRGNHLHGPVDALKGDGSTN
jgi:hypothetical protein